MPTTVARSPDADPLTIDLLKRTSERNGVSVIADLKDGVNFLPRKAFTRSEIAVVIDQYGKAILRKYFTVLIQVLLLYSSKSVGHDDGRILILCLPFRNVQPPSELQAIGGFKADVTAHCCLSKRRRRVMNVKGCLRR
ncbi:hypothetical protein D3C81_1241130 [compost metagenome]